MPALFSQIYYTFVFFFYFVYEDVLRRTANVQSKVRNYPDLDGQVWIVTGGNGGLGLETTLALVKQGAKVWITCRSKAKAQKAIEDILAQVPKAKLDYFLVDYNDLATIKPGVVRFLNAETKLNGVVHNAGVMLTPLNERTKQGYELQLGINNVGPHLLQKFLDEPLVRTSNQSLAPGRLVWVTSSGHLASPFPGGVNWADPTDVGAFSYQAYGVSKALDVILSIQWNIQHPGANVVSVSAHPGPLKTELYKHVDSTSFFTQYLLPPVYGSYTALYAALSPDLTTTKNQNAFIEPFGKIGRARSDVVAAAKDPKRGNAIWAWLEKQVDSFV